MKESRIQSERHANLLLIAALIIFTLCRTALIYKCLRANDRSELIPVKSSQHILLFNTRNVTKLIELYHEVRLVMEESSYCVQVIILLLMRLTNHDVTSKIA